MLPPWLGVDGDYSCAVFVSMTTIEFSVGLSGDNDGDADDDDHGIALQAYNAIAPLIAWSLDAAAAAIAATAADTVDRDAIDPDIDVDDKVSMPMFSMSYFDHIIQCKQKAKKSRTDDAEFEADETRFCVSCCCTLCWFVLVAKNRRAGGKRRNQRRQR